MKIGVWEPEAKSIESLTQADWKLALKGLQILYPDGYEPADWTGIGNLTLTHTAALHGGKTTEYTGDYEAIKNVAFSLPEQP